MENDKFVEIRIIGQEEELIEFAKLCKYIQSFGRYGMNRTIHVNVDGDGSGRLRFLDSENNELPHFQLDDLHKIEDQLGEFNVDIGE